MASRAKRRPWGAGEEKLREGLEPATVGQNTPFIEKLDTASLGGLRTGEVLGLDGRDVDLQQRHIRVRQQLQGGELGPLKACTRTSARGSPRANFRRRSRGISAPATRSHHKRKKII